MTMLQWLRGLFKASSAASGRVRSVRSAEAAENDLPPPFLRRESMLDRTQQVVAYVFGVETPGAMQAHAWRAASLKFFDEVLIEHFASGKLAGLLDKRLAFLPIGVAGLRSHKLETLPRDHLVIEFVPPADGVYDRESVLARLRGLHAEGFQLACGDILESQGLAEALTLARFISLGNVAKLNPPDLLARCRGLAARYPESGLIAREIDSIELHQTCRQLGIHLFQGRFLTHRDTSPSNKIAPYRVFVLQLLNGIRQQVDFNQLARIAWRDPALAYRLLRFVNSAAFGLRVKIDDLKIAMTYLGRDQLYRWLTLLMFSSREVDHLDDALRENALVRARLAERLAEGRLTLKECDEAFVVGILSLIDALLAVPMSEALAQLSLPDAVADALLRGEGKYAPYLKLAIACEESDQDSIRALAEACGMDAVMVNLRHIEALTWALRFSEALEESRAGP